MNHTSLPQSATTTARYQRRREEVLAAAARLFNRRGVRGTTLGDVAASVGLSANGITYYFRKKEDLALACLLRTLDEIRIEVDRAAMESTAEHRVSRFLAGFFRRLADARRGRAAELMSLRDLQALGATYSEAALEAYAELFQAVRGLLRDGSPAMARGVALDARTRLLLTSSVMAMNWDHHFSADDHALLAARVADVLLGGVAAPASVWRDSPLDAALSGTEADTGCDTQESYLRAATALINVQGYRGTSVERIARQVNLTKGSFYHHHQNKEELIAACFERSFGVIRRKQAVAMASAGSGWDKLTAVARSLVRYQFSPQGPLLRASAGSELTEEVHEDKRRTSAELTQRFVGFLVDGMKDGSVRAVDQTLAALLIAGMINASVVLDRWAGEMAADTAVEEFVRPLFVGLLAD